MCWLLVLVVAASSPALVRAHGRLMEPPARNSMWRFGFLNPINYNDNELFCGGVDTQFNRNEGRCGVCGDDYADPRPQTHETGGEFGNGIISKTYVMGAVVGLEIEITANHRGAFQFKLCPLGPRDREATQECLDKHPLTSVEDDDIYFHLTETPHSLTLTRTARLPPGLTCARCVLQWTWRSANSWGFCGNGTGAMGCGPQETFRNCADVRIVRTSAQLPATDNPRAILVRDSNSKTGLAPLVVRSQVCVATQLWSQYQGMDDWCQLNCLRYPPHCPSTMCTCLTSCRAAPGPGNLTDFECNKRCLRYPHSAQCPRQCRCSGEPGPSSSGLEAVIVDARSQPAVEDVETRSQEAEDSPTPILDITRSQDYLIPAVVTRTGPSLIPLSPLQWHMGPRLYQHLLY